jgi:hypothetical protein
MIIKRNEKHVIIKEGEIKNRYNLLSFLVSNIKQTGFLSFFSKNKLVAMAALPSILSDKRSTEINIMSDKIEGELSIKLTRAKEIKFDAIQIIEFDNKKELINSYWRSL